MTPRPRDPVADLRRIAFLLERDGAATYRVRAFRGAANHLADLDPHEVATRATTATLRDLPGIGPTTATAIGQSLTGERPDYLRELEARGAEGDLAAGDAGHHLRRALRGDCHTHSDWSDGGSPIIEMAETACALGHQYMALTDHSPRLRVANGLSAQRLAGQLRHVSEIHTRLAPFRILTGIEVDILDDGSLDQRDDLLDQLDVVVASVHSKLRMPAPEMTNRMLTAVRDRRVDVLGHCTGRLLTGRTPAKSGRPPSTFDAHAVFTACAEHAVAVEINCRPERLDPPRALLRLAVELGCVFTIDTDAHAPGQLDWQGPGCARAEECGVRASAVLNTRGATDLLAAFAKEGSQPCADSSA